MAINNSSVDSYLEDGCGRCERYRTPACKVHQYPGALAALRAIVLAAGLTEEMKWGSPSYTLDGELVLMLGTYNDCCFISFMRGALLEAPDGVLERVGPDTHASRLFKFTVETQVTAQRDLVARLVADSIALHKAGTKVPPRASPEPMPEELQDMLDTNPDVAGAYQALTPGRRRSYILHVSGAKQSKTRRSRAEASITKILCGKGFNER